VIGTWVWRNCVELSHAGLCNEAAQTCLNGACFPPPFDIANISTKKGFKATSPKPHNFQKKHCHRLRNRSVLCPIGVLTLIEGIGVSSQQLQQHDTIRTTLWVCCRIQNESKGAIPTHTASLLIGSSPFAGQPKHSCALLCAIYQR
jgi:hypothetical protein